MLIVPVLRVVADVGAWPGRGSGSDPRPGPYLALSVRAALLPGEPGGMGAGVNVTVLE